MQLVDRMKPADISSNGKANVTMADQAFELWPSNFTEPAAAAASYWSHHRYGGGGAVV